MTSTFRDLALLAISGLATWLAFPGTGLWGLLILSVPLLVGVLERVTPVRAALYGAWWMMFFFVPLTSWMLVATEGSHLAWFGAAAVQAVIWAAWGATVSGVAQAKWAEGILVGPAAIAFLWVGFEQIRSMFPFGGFPWGNISFPQVDSPLKVFAPLGGEPLVSFMVVFASVLLWRLLLVLALRGTLRGARELARAGGGLALLILGSAALSFALLPTSAQNGTLKVGAVQGNIEAPMAHTFGVRGKVTTNHLKQTLELVGAGSQVDLVLWGEHSVDRDPRFDDEVASIVERSVAATGVPQLVGFLEVEGNKTYNWAGIWYPDRGLDEVGLYGKQHPVPWGEYLPFRELTVKVAPVAARVSGDMQPVDNVGLVDVKLNDGKNVPLAVGICFEVAYEQIVAEGVREGGEMVVIPTNNAHFQNSDESVQQLQMAQFRSVEFSRAAVQVSTNGVSGLIAPDGELISVTGTQEANYLVDELPLRTTLTPAVYTAGPLRWIAVTGSVAVFVFMVLRSAVRKRKTSLNGRELRA